MSLNLLGINILPVAEYDHLLLAARNEQISLRIEMAEIAREQPASFQHGSRRVLTGPVALHHDRAANRDLAHGWTFLLRLWMNDLRFDPGQGRPYRADYVARRLIAESRAGRL